MENSTYLLDEEDRMPVVFESWVLGDNKGGESAFTRDYAEPPKYEAPRAEDKPVLACILDDERYPHF